MAEVRLCCGRGVLAAARTVCERNLLTVRKKPSRRTAPPPLISAACRLRDVTAQRVTAAPAGPPRDDAYTRGSGTERHRGFGPGGSSLEKDGDVGRKGVGRGAVLTSRAALTSLAAGRRCGHVLVFTRAYGGNGGREEPLYRSKSGYYELLEVAPTATHAQIKTAYYKQSFLFHPDRNAGSDAATARFSDISEAYTVLGNKGLRRKYDRGLLSASDLTATVRPSARSAGPGAGAARPQGDPRRSIPGMDTRSADDFDKFFQSHYSEQLQREKDFRVRKEALRKAKERAGDPSRVDGVAELGVLVLVIGLLICLSRA